VLRMFIILILDSVSVQEALLERGARAAGSSGRPERPFQAAQVALASGPANGRRR
jgi:hypothetical protein